MKAGIIAALALVLVGFYLLFATDLVRPAPTGAAARSEANEQALDSRANLGAKAGQGNSAASEEAGEAGGVTPPTEAGEAAPGSGDPKLTKDPQAGTTPDGLPVVTTFTRNDGTVVRDHRPNAPPPDLDAYAVLPASVSKVTPNTVMAVQRALRPLASACIKSHSAGKEEGARLQLFLGTSISSELLRVDSARVKISGLSDSEALQTCVQQAVNGHELELEGAEDVNLHRMVFTYPL